MHKTIFSFYLIFFLVFTVSSSEKRTNADISSDSTEKEILISIDAPDPDNLYMLQVAAKAYPQKVIHVILSPRPVDLNVKYGDNKDFLDSEGKFVFPQTLSAGFMPRDPDGNVIYSSRSDTRESYYEQSRLFHDTINLKHSKLVHTVSVVRILDYLDKCGVNICLFHFYHDFSNSIQKIASGMHYHLHKPDYLFGLSNEEMKQAIDQLTSIDHESRWSEKRGKQAEMICKNYIERVLSRFTDNEAKNKHIKDIYNSFSDVESGSTLDKLIFSLKNSTVRLVGGGPLTEITAIFKRGQIKIEAAFIMAGAQSIGESGGANVFPEQFNFLVDHISAKFFLDYCLENKILTVLIPTEVMKNWRQKCASTEMLMTTPYCVDIDKKQRWFGQYGRLLAEIYDPNAAVFDVGPILASKDFDSTDFKIEDVTVFQLMKSRFQIIKKDGDAFLQKIVVDPEGEFFVAVGNYKDQKILERHTDKFNDMMDELMLGDSTAKRRRLSSRNRSVLAVGLGVFSFVGLGVLSSFFLF